MQGWIWILILLPALAARGDINRAVLEADTRQRRNTEIFEKRGMKGDGLRYLSWSNKISVLNNILSSRFVAFPTVASSVYVVHINFIAHYILNRPHFLSDALRMLYIVLTVPPNISNFILVN